MKKMQDKQSCSISHKKKRPATSSFRKDWMKYKYLFILLIPGLIYFLLFCYVPMGGTVIAFENYKINKGILGSEWVGFEHFRKFFSSKQFWPVIRNTFLLNFYTLIWGFPLPIIFAVMLSEVKNEKFRKAIQTMSFMPYFISMVIAVGLVNMLATTNGGVINNILELLGHKKIDFLVEPKWFRTVYVVTSIWKNFGWNSVIYLAAIIGIDQGLYEAAELDGASKIQRIMHVTIPMIMPTVVVMLILNIGNLMTSSFDLAYLLQQPLNQEVSEVISTFVYKRGIAASGTFPQYSYATAVGLFQSVINIALLFIANKTSKKITGNGLY